MAIVFKDVRYSYLPRTNIENTVLRNINLHISPGECIAVMGSTGSGKSTLLKHLNSLLIPSCGTVTIGGTTTTSKNFAEVRQKVGMVMQYPEHQLFEENVYKDIAFILKKRNLPDDIIDDRIDEMVGLLKLDKNMLHASPFELSGGQKRKVAIAGVLVGKPDILALDEPTAGLDNENSGIILDLIHTLNKHHHVTVVLVSHSIEDVMKVANRIIILEQGYIQIDISTSDIFNHQDALEGMGLYFPPVTSLMKLVNQTLNPEIHYKLATVQEAKAELVKFIKRTGPC